MNKTQRRKAIQQWEAENEYAIKAGRGHKKDPKKKYVKPAEAQKKHVTGGHNREFRQKAKRKKEYGNQKKTTKNEDSD